jgi:VanZ family protein
MLQPQPVDPSNEVRDQPTNLVQSRRLLAGRTLQVLLYSLAILYFGTRRHLKITENELFSHDKLLHVLAFGGLAFVGYRCSRMLWASHSTLRAAWVAFGFAALMGLLLELIQSFLPYRSAEFADWVADACGAAAVLLFMRRFERPNAGLAH